MNRTSINIVVQLFLWLMHFIYLGHLPRSGIVGSYGISIFSFLRASILLHNNHPNSHSSQQCARIPFSSHSLQYLFYFLFSAIADLNRVRWYLTGLWFSWWLVMLNIFSFFLSLFSLLYLLFLLLLPLLLFDSYWKWIAFLLYFFRCFTATLLVYENVTDILYSDFLSWNFLISLLVLIDFWWNLWGLESTFRIPTPWPQHETTEL